MFRQRGKPPTQRYLSNAFGYEAFKSRYASDKTTLLMLTAKPWLMRLCPLRWREGVYYRLFQRRAAKFLPLYQCASIECSHGAFMWNLVPGDIISGSVAFTGVYEWHLTQKIVQLVQGGAGRFIDVGANMGYFSILWGSLTPKAKVTSFEPIERNVKLLTRNRDGNNLGDRIEIIAKAASDSNGGLTFDPGPPDQTGWGGISPTGPLTIPCVRLDDAIGDERVDLMKIDVEGAEAFVLRGAERLMRQGTIRRVVFEYNSERAADHLGDNARSIMESHGYRCQRFCPGMWLAERLD